MSEPKSHAEKIREQFNKYGEAYIKFDYVSEEKGLKRLVQLAGAGPDDAVIDVACGPGNVALAFAKVCRESVGVDVTDKFLAMAKEEAARQGVRNVRFVQGDVNQLEFANGRFDIAVCRAAFHHFPEPGEVLAEMVRVVKPGGRLMVLDMVASEDPKKAAYHHEMETLCDPTHARALSKSQFNTLFKEAGLTVLLEKEGETAYPVDAWIEHGGPPQHDRQRIRELLEACLEYDHAGIPVWRTTEGTLMMAHPGIAFVLARA